MADAGKTMLLNLKDKDGRVYRIQMPTTANAHQMATPIKEEIIEDEEASVLCSRCSKAFYNHVALRNHLKLQHNVDLAEVEVSCSPGKSQSELKPEPEPEPAPAPQLTIKLGDISVDPQQLLQLASEKVSYIIVKADGLTEKRKPSKKSGTKRRHNFQEEGPSPKTSPRKNLSKKREPVELVGPFECLKRSSGEPDDVCRQMFFNCCEYSLHLYQEHTRRRNPSFKCQVCEKQLGGTLDKLQQNVELAEVELSYSPRNSEPELEPEPASSSAPQQPIKMGDISMDPHQLMQLASEKVKYIIVKTDKKFGRRRRRVGQGESALRKNMLIEGGRVELAGPFECLQHSSGVPGAVCHQMFFNCCEYSLHFYREHTRRRKPGFKCQVCEKQLDAMLAGMEEALADRQCLHCKLVLADAGALEEHIKVAHVRPKPFKCTVCSKGFTQPGGLMQHMRMHTGDRPFPCSVCAKAFSQKSGLDQHMRTHTKIKPFRCVVCDKSFVQSIHLKQHMRTHTNIMPFKCTICQGRFKQSSHLKLHLKSHGITSDQMAQHSEVLASTETRTVQQRGILQLQENSSVEVEETQQEDPSVSMEENQEEGVSVENNEQEDHTVYMEECQEEDTTVYEEEYQEEDATVYVEEGQEEDDSVYVEEGQEEDNSACIVENQEEGSSVDAEEQREEDSSVDAEEQGEEDSSDNMEEKQEEDGSDNMEEKREEDGSVDADVYQEEEASDYAEEHGEASLVVEVDQMEEEYIIESSDEMETVLS